MKIVVFSLDPLEVPNEHYTKTKFYPACTPFRVLHFGNTFTTVKACGRGNHREFDVSNFRIGMPNADGELVDIYSLTLAEYICNMCP